MKDFEDLECWQEARKLMRLVYAVTKQNEFARDFGLRDQIQRASISAMANIAEGHHSGSDLEFIRFLGYSARSCSEVRSHLYAALDLGYVEKKEFDEMTEQARKTSNFVRGFIRY
ncbi:four helix bundle protein, partial [bacterium]|nr:four helix bundle protein [bacterium]MBU1918952.1 four helix bundle protein [bacterium]